jgi:uncharacterized protein YacL
MAKLSKYLKVLYLQDVIYGAIGGFIGGLIAVFMGNASYLTIPTLALIGMVFSAFIIARKRLNSDNQNL